MMDNKQKILDIAMNLNRIGNWAADDYLGKRKRIQTFISNTSNYIETLDSSLFRTPFKDTLKDFLRHYKQLESEGLEGPKDSIDWAEKMMTWGNILTHRSKLI